MKSESNLQIFFLSAIWGVSFLLIRVAGRTFPPAWVALLRSSLETRGRDTRGRQTDGKIPLLDVTDRGEHPVYPSIHSALAF